MKLQLVINQSEFNLWFLGSIFLTDYLSSCKQYLYEFGFDGNLNLFKKLLGMDDGPGACHVDDLCHLFE